VAFLSDVSHTDQRPDFWGDLRAEVLSHRVLVVWFGLSIILTITGPFGTYQTTSLPLRATYWSGLLAVSIALAFGLRRLVKHLLSGWSLIGIEIVTSAGFALLFTPVVVVVTHQLKPPSGLIDVTFPGMFPTVYGIAICVSCIRVAIVAAFTEPLPAPAAAPRLADRLGDIGVATILCVCSANHHVLVVLSDGRIEKLLMRHADAVAEMEGVPGLYIHRSHWVVLAAVSGYRVDGARTRLVMSDGSELPVSRGYLPAVRAAGLLGGPPVP
jgi:hypothetical protein